MHLPDRRSDLRDRANVFDHEPMRQKSLINQLHHSFVALFQPNRPKMLPADLHSLLILFLLIILLMIDLSIP
jgi:hypothetical protein